MRSLEVYIWMSIDKLGTGGNNCCCCWAVANHQRFDSCMILRWDVIWIDEFDLQCLSTTVITIATASCVCCMQELLQYRQCTLKGKIMNGLDDSRGSPVNNKCHHKSNPLCGSFCDSAIILSWMHPSSSGFHWLSKSFSLKFLLLTTTFDNFREMQQQSSGREMLIKETSIKAWIFSAQKA